MPSPPPDPGTLQLAPDPRIARAEERLAMLRELSEMGMAMTRDLTRRALERPAPPEPAPRAPPAAGAGPAPPGAAPPNAAPPGHPPVHPLPSPRAAAPRHDPAEAFARLSRAVRLTLALETRADDDLARLRAGGSGAAAHGPLDRPDHEAGDGHDVEDLDHEDDDPGFEPPPRDHGSPRRNRIRDLVFDVINAEVADVHQAHEILDALHDRLIEGEHYDTVVFGPVRDAVEAVCEDLGLHPDWRLWTGEGWLAPPPQVPCRRWQTAWAPRFLPSARRQQ